MADSVSIPLLSTTPLGTIPVLHQAYVAIKRAITAHGPSNVGVKHRHIAQGIDRMDQVGTLIQAPLRAIPADDTGARSQHLIRRERLHSPERSDRTRHTAPLRAVPVDDTGIPHGPCIVGSQSIHGA